MHELTGNGATDQSVYIQCRAGQLLAWGAAQEQTREGEEKGKAFHRSGQDGKN
jgi:hypothetical protein